VSRSPRVGVVVAYPGVQLLDVVGPAEVFAGASRVVAPKPGYRPLVATPDGQPARGESGLRLHADARLSRVDEGVDTLLIAGGWSYDEAMRSDDLLAEVRRLAARARRVGLVCSGAFVLAGARCWTGRAATTHCAVCERLGRDFPEVTVEPDRIFVRDGPCSPQRASPRGWSWRWRW
jgi:transcriptional regulator GlxA family with amidase domain